MMMRPRKEISNTHSKKRLGTHFGSLVKKIKTKKVIIKVSKKLFNQSNFEEGIKSMRRILLDDNLYVRSTAINRPYTSTFNSVI